MIRTTGVILILLSCFLLWSLQGVPFEAAIFPRLLLAILIVLSFVLVIGRWKARESFENLRDVTVAALMIIAYSVSLPFTGFPVTTGVMLWASMWLGGYKGPKYRLPLIAVLLAGVIYWVFFKLVGVPEP